MESFLSSSSSSSPPPFGSAYLVRGNQTSARDLDGFTSPGDAYDSPSAKLLPSPGTNGLVQSSPLEVYVVIFSVVVLVFAVTILCYIRRINPYIHSQSRLPDFATHRSGPPSSGESSGGSSLGQSSGRQFFAFRSHSAPDGGAGDVHAAHHDPGAALPTPLPLSAALCRVGSGRAALPPLFFPSCLPSSTSSHQSITTSAGQDFIGVTGGVAGSGAGGAKSNLEARATCWLCSTLQGRGDAEIAEDDDYDRLPCEHSIAAARASVMTYDDGLKKWVPAGASSGLSKVHVYHHALNNTFRVVGRKIQDHEVVINCAILKGLKYNQATTTFHQWRDNRQVYGLNFTCREDAETFANAMGAAIETLNNYSNRALPAAQSMATPNAYAQSVQPQQQQQQLQQQQQQPAQLIQNGYGPIEDYGISTNSNQYDGKATTPTSVVPQNNASQMPQGGIPAAPAPPPANTVPPAPPPPPLPAPAGPPAPPPPPPPPGAAPRPPVSNIPPPPAPPPPPVGGPPPPPPPPPPVPKTKTAPGGSFADQLAAKQLRKADAGASPAPRGPPGGPPGGPPAGPPGDFLAELMQKQRTKTLKRGNREERGGDPISDSDSRETETSPTNATTPSSSLERSKQNGNFNLKNGHESPKPLRKNFRSREDGLNLLANGVGDSTVTSSELEKVKQEILTEMRMEMSRMKEDIIQAIRDMGRN